MTGLVRVTARCHFCTRRFVAEVAPNADPVTGAMTDDDSGQLCCDDCQCRTCGRGHFTEAEHEDCAVDAAESYADSLWDGDFCDDPFDYRLDFPADLELSS
jgi:hypothetical protein